TCLDTLFFCHVKAITWLYTLSLHDALPISKSASAATCTRAFPSWCCGRRRCASAARTSCRCSSRAWARASTSSPPTSSKRCWSRSEEHTSELQSRENLVCRLLLEKKKQDIR